MSSNDQKTGWGSVFVAPILIVFLVWAIAPALTNTKNATVYLEGCTEPDCALKGDLTVNFFTRAYELKQADGSVISFDSDAINIMSWPAPEE